MINRFFDQFIRTFCIYFSFFSYILARFKFFYSLHNIAFIVIVGILNNDFANEQTKRAKN